MLFEWLCSNGTRFKVERCGNVYAVKSGVEASSLRQLFSACAFRTHIPGLEHTRAVKVLCL